MTPFVASGDPKRKSHRFTENTYNCQWHSHGDECRFGVAARPQCCSAAVVGSTMVVVEAIDEGAAHFYELHGFIKLPESMRLVLEMAQIAKLRR